MSGVDAQSNFWNSKDAYLAEMPPGDTPKIFAPGRLADSGYFSCDRVIFSNDGKELYYAVDNKWYDGKNLKIKCFRFENGKWVGPFVVQDHYSTEIFSIDEKTMYMMGGPDLGILWQAQRTQSGWTAPQTWGSHQTILYDFSPTQSGQIYGATNNFTGEPKRPGNFDVCTLSVTGADTVVRTLGVPVNAPGWNGDFYISPDESYLIVSAKETKDYECKLFISFRKPDKTWTNPKSLGPLINQAVSHRWGVTVTPDNKYIFYTFGESEKETAIYWARFDRLLETLKHTNFEPYVRDSVPDQQARAGQLFSFRVKDEVFFDDDGNNTLKLSASSPDGGPLPAWLTFNIKGKDPFREALFTRYV